MKKVFFSTLLSLTLFSCTKEILVDNDPQLKLIIQDSEDNKISDASVSLYLNVDDWSKNQNVVTTKNTDSSGEVNFEGLEEEVYFFYVEKDEKNNRYGVSQVQDKLRINERRILNITIKPF